MIEMLGDKTTGKLECSEMSKSGHTFLLYNSLFQCDFVDTFNFLIVQVELLLPLAISVVDFKAPGRM
jgi:hypothetical protein